jgi:hypothetical protein
MINNSCFYLYVKQHNKTGLKYFGKTQAQDPYKYSGSGIHWIRHLKKHGNDISTIELWKFENIEECSKFALDFSIKNDIVSSKDWANKIIENGVDGWPKGLYRGPQTAEHRQKNSKANSGRNNPMYGVNKDPEFMKEIGKIGLDRQKKLRDVDPVWVQKEKQKFKSAWENEQRKQAHTLRFKRSAPAVDSISKTYLGLVPTNDPRWNRGEICSPQKGIKKGTTKAKGIPKPKLICRLFDKKEMDLPNFKKWVKKYE